MEKTKCFRGALAVFLVVSAWTFSAWAVDYPTKPITVLVPYAPGGASDIMTRALATALEPLLGQPIAVSNKPGATGATMMTQLAHSKPDGYTIGNTPGSLAVTPYLQQVPYDIAKDFTYLVALNTYMDAFTVRTDSPWKTLKDLMDYARQNPKKLRVGMSGLGGSTTVMTKFVSQQAAAEVTMIPFKGDGEVVTALLGDHIEVGCNNGAQISHVRAGTLRMLALALSERVSDFPDVPTFKELGYDFVTLSLSGMAGPKGMPEAIVQKLIDALVKAREDRVYLETIRKLYLHPQNEIGKDFEKRIVEIHRRMGEYSKLK